MSDIRLKDGTEAGVVKLSQFDLPLMALAVTLFKMEGDGLLSKDTAEALMDRFGKTLKALVEKKDIPGLVEFKTKEEYEAALDTAKGSTTNEVLI